jgi:TraM recognition site of TraD and TraG/Helicase HerA, central domain
VFYVLSSQAHRPLELGSSEILCYSLRVQIVLSVPATNDRGPLYAEHALAAVHQGNPHRLPFTLGMIRRGQETVLSCVCPAQLSPIIEGQLFAQYPDARIDQVADDPPLPDGYSCWTRILVLISDVFPINRHAQFEDSLNRQSADPLTALLMTLNRVSDSKMVGRIEIRAKPAREKLRYFAMRSLKHVTNPFFHEHHRLRDIYLSLALSQWLPMRLCSRALLLVTPGARTQHNETSKGDTSSRTHDRESDLQAAADKLSRHLFECRILLTVIGPATRSAAAKAKLEEMAGAFGIFSSPHRASFHASKIRLGESGRHRKHGRTFLLSAEELATLWHPPTGTVRAERMARVESREFEPPPMLPSIDQNPDLALLGRTAFRSRRELVGILPDDRMRHVYIVGKTGMGKSTLLYNLILSDIAAGRGVGLIDPHGDLAESLLPALPKYCTNNVILFDAGDTSHPLAFNPLHCDDPARRPLVASGIISAFKKLFGDSWGPRLEYFLRNAILALVEVRGTTLVSILRLLTETRYRQTIVSQLTDPIVRGFWEREFAVMHPKLQVEAIAPIQNKVGAFVSSPLLRNIIGQPENRLSLRHVMDNQQVLIVNLSKGRIGEDSSTLLGSLLVSSLQLAAMSRSDVPETERKQFHLYVDEFQNFATDAFATILSEARKYRLSLTLANQYLGQVEEQTAAAVFGNVGSLLCFQVGANDSETLAEQLGSGMTPQDLMTLPRYQAYARLLIDGQPSRPFSIQTLPPATTRIDEQRAEIIRRYSRQRYAHRSSTVDRVIRQRMAAS